MNKINHLYGRCETSDRLIELLRKQRILSQAIYDWYTPEKRDSDMSEIDKEIKQIVEPPAKFYANWKNLNQLLDQAGIPPYLSPQERIEKGKRGDFRKENETGKHLI